VPAGIWYKDTENRLLRINQAAAKSVNMKSQDIEGMAVCDLFPRDAEHYFQDDLEVIRSGKPKLGIIERMQVPEGESRWVRTDKIPYRDEQGNISGVIAFVEDITERKKAEEQLRQESLMRKIILDNLPCVAMILKKQTREIVASNEAAREVGATPGKTCYGTCAEREHPCPFCLAPEIWATNEPRRLEVEYRERYYDRIWVPLTEDLYVHYIFDITDTFFIFLTSPSVKERSKKSSTTASNSNPWPRSSHLRRSARGTASRPSCTTRSASLW
jgi:PAS domain S-box-containing protein